MRQVIIEFCRPRWSFLGFLAHLALYLGHRRLSWHNITTMVNIKTYNKEHKDWMGFEIDGSCVRGLKTAGSPPTPRGSTREKQESGAVSQIFVCELYLSEELFATLWHYLGGSLRASPTFTDRLSLFVKRFLGIFGVKTRDLFAPGPKNAEKCSEALLIAIGNLDDFKSVLSKHDPVTLTCCDFIQIMIEGGV